MMVPPANIQPKNRRRNFIVQTPPEPAQCQWAGNKARRRAHAPRRRENSTNAPAGRQPPPAGTIANLGPFYVETEAGSSPARRSIAARPGDPGAEIGTHRL